MTCLLLLLILTENFHLNPRVFANSNAILLFLSQFWLA